MHPLKVLFTLMLVALSPFSGLTAAEYDPLSPLEEQAKIQWIDLDVDDEIRKRQLPIRVYLPAETTKAPLVIFSHGLGGNREGSAFLGKHWAAHGYVAVFLQHPGSDDSVWQDQPLRQRMSALQQAASLENYRLRLQDVPALLDQLTKWNAQTGHELFGRMDLTQVGMSGHSFGAQTTQAVSGQSAPLIGARFTDPRIKAAVIMSPSVPKHGSAEKAFGKVQLPWLLMTGTLDSSPIGNQSPESRTEVFPALPAGDKYQIVLHDAEHSAFTERALPGETGKRNPNHHRVILALSTAFWDAYLKHDPAAKQWLQGDGPKQVLQPQDQWQAK